MLSDELAAAFLGAEKVFFAVDDIPEGMLARQIGAADFILDHRPPDFPVGSAGPLLEASQTLEKPDNNVDEIENDGDEDDPEERKHT